MQPLFQFHKIIMPGFVLCLCLSAPALATVQLPQIFGDNMVLQCDQEIVIWGWAAPGEQVSVRFVNQEKSVLADDTGNWRVQLTPMPANAVGQELVVTGSNQIRWHNVVVGEVWLCAGQSNMEFPVQSLGQEVLNAGVEVAAADYPALRLLTIETQTAFSPRIDIKTRGWLPCSPLTVVDFSAVAYFFGRGLYHELKVPIGLIVTAKGSTPAEAWTSPAALKTLADFQPVLAELPTRIDRAQANFQVYRHQVADWFAELDRKDPGFTGAVPTWAGIDFVSSHWATMQVPGTWERAGFANHDGVMWFRKEFELPAAWPGQPLLLSLPGINDMHRAFFNGEQIGAFEETRGWTLARTYSIAAESIRPGRNVIAVRVLDLAHNGGMCGRPQDLWLQSQSDSSRISLVGAWQCQPSLTLAEMPPFPGPGDDILNNPTVAGVLFNGMIHPLTSFRIRGVIWYQGEANVGRAEGYRLLFPTLIRDWRAWWQAGDLPFLFVQLANYQGNATTENYQMARLREAQLAALALPNTAMAVTIDIGASRNIHPANKQDVGQRLVLPALRLAYGKEPVFSGPIYQKFIREGQQIRIFFQHTGTGLMVGSKSGLDPVQELENGKLAHLEIAGIDRKWQPATGKIDGHSLLVWNKKVPAPAAVRYAFSMNPAGCNLYNKQGLPASPFRTNDW